MRGRVLIGRLRREATANAELAAVVEAFEVRYGRGRVRWEVSADDHWYEVFLRGVAMERPESSMEYAKDRRTTVAIVVTAVVAGLAVGAALLVIWLTAGGVL